MLCICAKRMLVAANDGTCLWCGHGDIHVPRPRRRLLPRLPRDLGALLREGRRPDPRCENVIARWAWRAAA